MVVELVDVKELHRSVEKYLQRIEQKSWSGGTSQARATRLTTSSCKHARYACISGNPADTIITLIWDEQVPSTVADRHPRAIQASKNSVDSASDDLGQGLLATQQKR